MQREGGKGEEPFRGNLENISLGREREESDAQ